MTGALLPANNQDIVIGRVREPAIPYPSFSIAPHHPAWYSLDGILDEVAIYDHSLSPDEIERAYEFRPCSRRRGHPLARASLGAPRRRTVWGVLCNPQI